jgi:hypothetical protein
LEVLERRERIMFPADCQGKKNRPFQDGMMESMYLSRTRTASSMLTAVSQTT